ncbi:holo-ACP synthase [Leucobacter luti]|uniref:Holo-[acyl-carrier-protein] synthase n=1 Tax=Leucobacter luti TaxID=340320 RepID=A0A4Q7TXT0_9MICO|nr:holo-ACP synthase [Leucobacter luti]MBL3698657.1 holo-ACP synthase [Leucobacter luti]RZT66031.1 holo-[acyl-carrier protein] synthase [Leucobacter luti]
MIIGIGVDTVDIARFERQLERVPALRERLFTPAERELRVASLAARFAAKEALIKALGGSDGVSWQDLDVVRGVDRAPSFAPTPGLAAALAARGAHETHLSMTHDAGVATAFVIVERRAGAEYARTEATDDGTGQQ